MTVPSLVPVPRSRTDEARAAIRDNARELDRLLGVDAAWRFLFEVADELVTVATRERRL